MVTGDRNGGVHAWEAETGNEILSLNGHSKSITAIDWRIDGKLVLTASEDGTLRIWDGTNGKQIKNWNACGPGVTSACFTRDGLIVTGGRDRLVRVWDQNGKLVHQYEAMTDQVTSVAYCSEKNRVIAGDWQGKVHVWDKPNAKPVGWLNCNPPTLQARIADLSQQLAQANEIYKPLAAQAVEMDSRIKAMKAENEAEIATRTTLETKLNAAKAKLASADKLLKSTVEQQQAWRTELANKEKAVPQVDASLTSAKSALETLGQDKEMTEMVAKLEARQVAIVARIGTLKAQLDQATKKQETVKVEIAALTIERDESTKQVAALNVTISAREMELGKANDQRTKHQVVLSKAQADVQRPTGSLHYWNGELQFAKALADLESNLKSAEDVEQQKLDAVDAALEKMAAAQSVVDQARQTRAEFGKQVEAVEEQIRALKGK